MGIGSGILIQLLQASKLACFHFPEDMRFLARDRRLHSSEYSLEHKQQRFHNSCLALDLMQGSVLSFGHLVCLPGSWDRLYLGLSGFSESGYRDAVQPGLGLSVFLPQLLQSPDIRYVPPYPTHPPSAQRVFVLERVYLSAKVPVREATSEAARISWPK